MPKPSSVSSSPQVLQTVAWARKYGFRPVPLHPGSKAASSRNYVDLDYKPPDDEYWHNRNLGVGVVTGPRHKGPVDVDLDWKEAVFFAERFLPHTSAVFGRASKLKSHYIYHLLNCDQFEKLTYLDPVTKTSILELRGDGGHQTVFPGSVHPSGEPVEWQDKAPPEMTQVITRDTLVTAARRVAAACLIARHVWRPGFHNEPCKHLAGICFYSGWSLDDAVALIHAVMDFTGDDDKSRIPTVRATYRRGEQGKKITGAGALRKVLDNDPVVDKLLEWMGSEASSILQQYNERFATVMVEGRFRIADFQVPPGEAPVLMLKEDFLNLTSTDTAVGAKGKPVPKANVWLRDARRRHYGRVDFMPGVEDDDSGTLNLWTGWAVRPEKGDCSAWLVLLKDVICGGDAELFNWQLHWFANIVREPMNKALTSPVIIGDQGVGKSLLYSYFGRILGPAYVTVTNEEHIHGRFNRHFAAALLLHSEEALYGGDKKHRAIIKSLITDEYRIYEQKGIDAKRVRNFLRLALTSNEEHAAPAEAGDRRFTVINMRPRSASVDLIRRVVAERDSGGPAALYRYLLDMRYDPEVPRVNVKNEALGNLKDMNLSPLEAWWLDVLHSGCMLPDVLKDYARPAKLTWSDTVSSVALYAAMRYALGPRHPTAASFANYLNSWVGRKLERKQVWFPDAYVPDDAPQIFKNLGERQHTIYNLPTLPECRSAFERYRKQQISWPADEAPGEGPLQEERY